MTHLSVSQRRFLLSLHVVFSAIMLGETATVVILGLTAMTTGNAELLKACYTVFHLLSRTGFRYAPVFTVITGVMLAMMTPWGLFRYYWIIAKEIITSLSIATSMIGFYLWSMRGLSIVTAKGLSSFQDPVFVINNEQLLIGIILQMISLISIFFISIFKPWGRREID